MNWSHSNESELSSWAAYFSFLGLIADRIIGLRFQDTELAVEREIVATAQQRNVTIPKNEEGALDLEALAEEVFPDQEFYLRFSKRKNGSLALMMPYENIRTIFNHLSPAPGSTVVDLGSGWGRIGIALGLFFPQVNMVGYEFLDARASSARSLVDTLGLSSRVHFKTQDLYDRNFKPMRADYYIMYDPFGFEVQEKVLKDLYDLSQTGASFTVIAIDGRGSFLSDLARLPWLHSVAELSSVLNPNDRTKKWIQVFKTVSF